MRKLLLYAITFVAGAVFLGLEIVSSRVLAPYFGNSIFVWGSLISVFLAALTVGYFLGGRLADAYPSFRALAGVVAAAAASIIVLPWLYLPAGQAIAEAIPDVRLASLAACSLFFLAPGVLVGMVSPYLIRLAATELGLIGRVAGTIYAVSTLGSIAGALGVAFFLVPLIGTRAIIWLCGGTLALVAAACLAAHRLHDASTAGTSSARQTD